MNLPSSVKVLGIKWKLYSIDFDSPDGKFSAYLYAVDDIHASYQLEAMKETGVVTNIIADEDD